MTEDRAEKYSQYVAQYLLLLYLFIEYPKIDCRFEFWNKQKPTT